MDLPPTPDLVLRTSLGDKVRGILVAAAVPAALVAITLTIGLTPAALATAVAFIAIITLWLWWALFAVLTSAPPALTAAGIQLRPRPGRRTSTLLPWSEITSIGLLPITRTARTYLKITAADAVRYPGPRKDGINFIYLSPTIVTPQQIKDAVHRFTHGRLTAHDEPPRRSLVGR